MEQDNMQVSITFANSDSQGSYFLGQPISGVVTVNLLAETKLSNIYVGYLGIGKISNYTGVDVSVMAELNNVETRSETYLDELREIYNFNDHGSAKIRTAGLHEFPFTFLLPKDLPTSFESPEGFIRYVITAYIEGPEYELVTKRRMITINEIRDLNKDSRAKTPVFAHSSTKSCLSFGCFRTLAVNAEVHITCKGYTSGERIIINAEVVNTRRHPIQMVKITLEQVIKYSFKSGPKKFKRNVVEMVRGSVGPFDIQIWKDEPLLIPPVPASTVSNSNCKIINIWYKLRFSMHMSGTERKMMLTLPIIIGNVPLKKNWGNFEQGVGDSPLPGSDVPIPNFEQCIFGPHNIGDSKDEDYGIMWFSPLFACYNEIEENEDLL